ncbi:hypothetical protein L7F22_054083 [Adiantum nelumboides]|nr:hypothetical protein [Adiantum nelumboides]
MQAVQQSSPSTPFQNPYVFVSPSTGPPKSISDSVSKLGRFVEEAACGLRNHYNDNNKEDEDNEEPAGTSGHQGPDDDDNDDTDLLILVLPLEELQMHHLLPPLASQLDPPVSTSTDFDHTHDTGAAGGSQDHSILMTYKKHSTVVVSSTSKEMAIVIAMVPSTSTENKLGLKIQEPTVIKVKMANNSKARCLGVIKSLSVEVHGIKKHVDFFVMSAKGNGYSIILGHPWLMQMRALQDWETGRLICRNDNHKRIVYNMKEQRQEDVQVESTPSNTEEEFSTTTSEEDSDITTEEDSSMEVMGIRFRPVNKEQAYQVEEEVKEQPQEHNEEMIEGMLSKNLTQEERVEYKQMLQKFPNLFVKDYINVRGVDIVQHQIELKPESQSRAQKLRRLGVVKEEALLKEVRKLLSVGFIYPVDNSEWVSPVVVTPKKNEEDQKKATFITPWGCYAFRKVEEGLQRLNGFGGQLNPDKCHIGEDEVILLGHKISQRGIEVDPAKAKALLELPSPKSIKEVTSFRQKVKYMARFIH